MNGTALGIAAPNMPPFSFKACLCVCRPWPWARHLLVIPTSLKSPLSLRVWCKAPVRTKRIKWPQSFSRQKPNGRKPLPHSSVSALTPHAQHNVVSLSPTRCLSHHRRPRRSPIPPHDAAIPEHLSSLLYPLTPSPSQTAAYWGLKRDITFVTAITTIAVPPLRQIGRAHV